MPAHVVSMAGVTATRGVILLPAVRPRTLMDTVLPCILRSCSSSLLLNKAPDPDVIGEATTYSIRFSLALQPRRVFCSVSLQMNELHLLSGSSHATALHTVLVYFM